MQIVIDIQEGTYDLIKHNVQAQSAFENAFYAIRRGIVLPKGHGRLIDADALETAYGLERATKYGNESKEQLENSYSTMMLYEIADMLDYAPTIIEADKEVEDADSD